MKIANRFMSKFNIHFSLQMRVRKYLEFTIKEKTERISKDEESFLSKLSTELSDEVVFQAYGNIINSFPVIKDNFSIKTIRQIAKIIKVINCSPGELISQVKFINKRTVNDFISYLNYLI